MSTLLRILRLLSMVVWVGGIIFFAFVLAPIAFATLPSTHEAGEVVGATLRVLHLMGLIAGGIFAICTAILFLQSGAGSKGRYQNQLLLVAMMLAATAYLQASVLPAMEQDRVAAGGNIDAAPRTSGPRTHFERLHVRSERIEGGILLCGLGIILLMARESLPVLAPSQRR
ncbi:MAG TPA: DUF4149 domain-containing protein [Granulicella sp.]|nr:DUF4149 domain-containing protein [Granulicella sp.]